MASDLLDTFNQELFLENNWFRDLPVMLLQGSAIAGTVIVGMWILSRYDNIRYLVRTLQMGSLSMLK